MFLACPACETNYKLDDLALGPNGRKVRCVACGHVWRAVPPPTPDDALPPEPIDPFKSTDPIADQDMSLSFTADEPFTRDYDPSFDVDAQDGAQDEPFGRGAEQASERTYERQPIPEGIVRSAATAETFTPHDTTPVYQPMGMSANVVGLCVFLLPFLVTLAVGIVCREPLVKRLPALSPVYAAMGLAVEAPGGGLRLSTLVAERKIERDKKTLSMSAQLANVSPQAQPYPALKATAYGPYGALIKTWNLPAPADGRTLVSGEEAPIRAEFKDVPDAAAKLELRVTQP